MPIDQFNRFKVRLKIFIAVFQANKLLLVLF